MKTLRRIAQIASALLAVTLSMAAVPEKTRGVIDGILNAKGIYVADEGAYKFVMPREAATIVRDDQSLSPNIGLISINVCVTHAPGRLRRPHRTTLDGAQVARNHDAISGPVAGCTRAPRPGDRPRP